MVELMTEDAKTGNACPGVKSQVANPVKLRGGRCGVWRAGVHANESAIVGEMSALGQACGLWFDMD